MNLLIVHVDTPSGERERGGVGERERGREGGGREKGGSDGCR